MREDNGRFACHLCYLSGPDPDVLGFVSVASKSTFYPISYALISDQWPQSSFFLKNNDARSHHTMAMSGWDIQRNANLDGRK